MFTARVYATVFVHCLILTIVYLESEFAAQFAMAMCEVAANVSTVASREWKSFLAISRTEPSVARARAANATAAMIESFSRSVDYGVWIAAVVMWYIVINVCFLIAVILKFFCTCAAHAFLHAHAMNVSKFEAVSDLDVYSCTLDGSFLLSFLLIAVFELIVGGCTQIPECDRENGDVNVAMIRHSEIALVLFDLVLLLYRLVSYGERRVVRSQRALTKTATPDDEVTNKV